MVLFFLFFGSLGIQGWYLLFLKCGSNFLTNRQSSTNINTDGPPLPNWRTRHIRSPGDQSQPIVWRTGVRKKFSCPAGLACAAPPTGPTDGSDDLQPEGRWGLFSIISDKFVPFPAPHQSWPEEGHQIRNRLCIRTFHQNLSPPHRIIHVAGHNSLNRCGEENFWVLKSALSFTY